jgi:hypothetical protein
MFRGRQKKQVHSIRYSRIAGQFGWVEGCREHILIVLRGSTNTLRRNNEEDGQ